MRHLIKHFHMLQLGISFFEDMAAFESSMGPNSVTLQADVPNYTNIEPVLQISQVQTVQ